MSDNVTTAFDLSTKLSLIDEYLTNDCVDIVWREMIKEYRNFLVMQNSQNVTVQLKPELSYREVLERSRHEPDTTTMNISLDIGAYIPTRAYQDDAGLDLRTPSAVTVPAGGSVSINTGVHVELPAGYYGHLQSKSGLNVKHNIVSLGGTIDNSYRGAIVAKLYNLGDTDYTFSPGEKIVQLVVQPFIAPIINIVDELSNTDRGSNGFGSSGK